MRFSYYEDLSAAQKRIYRRSDELRAVPIPGADELAPLVSVLEAALATSKRAETQRAAQAFCAALFARLGAPPADVKVRTTRPHVEGGELHGLYTFAQRGRAPVIEVWMRTSAHKKVVRFRTFLRTLVHEIGHHLDASILGLEESFHTQGFFARESSLVRQLLPPKTPRAKTAAPPKKAVQLGLFDE
jgi:hypothetical protein